MIRERREETTEKCFTTRNYRGRGRDREADREEETERQEEETERQLSRDLQIGSADPRPAHDRQAAHKGNGWPVRGMHNCAVGSIRGRCRERAGFGPSSGCRRCGRGSAGTEATVHLLFDGAP